VLAVPAEEQPAGSSADISSRWSAVVVNHDAGDHLRACVASLLADDSADGPPDVVVVDNASTDGSADRLALEQPTLTVVRSPRNLGYARAANLGIAATRGSVVAVCNPDLTIAPGTGAAMMDRLATGHVAAVGPRVHEEDGTVYPSARRVPSVTDAVGHGLLGLVWSSNPFTRRYRELDADPDRTREVDWVSGAAIWLRRDALDAVGGWDEGYFMYVEDVDLCWRLRRAGWRVVYEPGGEVVHVGGVSTRTRPYRMILEHHRSLYRFARKRWSGPRRLLLGPAAVYLAARAVLAMLHHAASGLRDRGR